LFKTANGERVAMGHDSVTTLSKSFIIPITAKSGYTRMRVMMHYSSFLNQPCGSFVDGEVEDYTVNITGGAGSVVASAASETSNTTSSTAIMLSIRHLNYIPIQVKNNL